MFGIFAVLAGFAVFAVGILSRLNGNAQPGARPRLNSVIKSRTRDWAGVVETESGGVPSSLVLGVIARESGGDQNAHGRAGEIGLMQLTEAAVVDYMRENADPDVPDFGAVESGQINIRVGSWFLGRKIEEMGTRFHGLRAYNCGTFGARSNSTCGAEYARWILEVAEPEFRTVA